MEKCTTKTDFCLQKEKDGKKEYVIKRLNYTPSKAVDMSFCEDDDEDEEDEDEEKEEARAEDEPGDKPYCIEEGEGDYNLEYHENPPLGATFYAPGDKVGDKVLSDACELEGGGEVTGDPHFVMWSGQKFDVRPSKCT